MRHVHIYLAAFLAYSFWAIPIFSQDVRIAPLDGVEHCAGYDKTNIATMQIVAMPGSTVRPQTAFTYVWYAQHDKALKKWRTTFSNRRVPLPWPGTYQIWVEMQYIDVSNGQRRRYATFTSNTIQVQAHLCETPIPESDVKY